MDGIKREEATVPLAFNPDNCLTACLVTELSKSVIEQGPLRLYPE